MQDEETKSQNSSALRKKQTIDDNTSVSSSVRNQQFRGFLFAQVMRKDDIDSKNNDQETEEEVEDQKSDDGYMP